MTVTLLGDGATGVVSIYTGDPTDESPHNDPLNHLGRLKFHSSLAYPKVISEWTGTVNFPARAMFNGTIWVSPVGVATQSYTLFAHGRPGQPWVLGSARIGTVDVAMVGSVPVQQAFSANNPSILHPWLRWVSLGADATNVYIFEYTVIRHIASTNASAFLSMPAVGIDFKVWVTDELLS